MSADYWQRIYSTRALDAVGWYERTPETSLRLVRKAIEQGATSLIDVGGGASSLVDHLLDLGLERIAVLDIAEASLEASRRRLGARATQVEWIVGDATSVEDVGQFDVWHDRAVFHFLILAEDRKRYVRLAARTVGRGGTAVVATFGPDGPERCSGLPVHRYSPEQLANECGPSFRLDRSEAHVHVTPSGVPQSFVYSTFSRV